MAFDHSSEGTPSGICPVSGAQDPPPPAPPTSPEPNRSGPNNTPFPIKEGVVAQNFTIEQLGKFDGRSRADAPASLASLASTEELAPIYLSINSHVFDVSDSRTFYGCGGPYGKLAGKECGVALAKRSLNDQHLNNFDEITSLSETEKIAMDGWIKKFAKLKRYVGMLVRKEGLPDPDVIVDYEVLQRNDGTGPVPAGYAAPSIYVGAGTKVYDVSFGGCDFYSKGTSYACFAGKNASRALAKLSFDPKNTAFPVIVDDLNAKEQKALDDWIKMFEDVKEYPCVGLLP